jgi:outer membrane receptor for ferrienterochelin and colicins
VSINQASLWRSDAADSSLRRCLVWSVARSLVLVLLAGVGTAIPQAFSQENKGNANSQDLNRLSLEELMNVEVDTVYGASKFAQKVTEVPSSVTIITADEIQKYGYRTLADVLQSVPSFYVTSDRNYSYVEADGISRPTDYNTHLLILIDGHRVNDNIFDGAYVGTEGILDVDLIQRVEIIRGPGSSLYGTNAFLGVINIVTKKGRDLKGVEVSGDAGSLQTYRGRTTYGQQYASGLELLLSETAYDSKGHSELFFPEFNSPATNNGIARDGDGDQFHSTFLSASYGSFTLHSGYVSREKHIPTASYQTVFDDSRIQTTDARAYADLQYQHAIGDNWQINARGFYDWYKYDGVFIYDYAATGIPPFTVNNDYERGEWWGLDVSVSRQIAERHHLTLGTEENFDTKAILGNYDQQPYVSYLFNSSTSTRGSIYFQDEFAIRKNLLLSGGLRYDRYSTFGGTANPRLGLIFSPQEGTDIKVLYGQAFRAPDPFELHDYAFGPGNPNLHPERIKTAEVIYEKHFRPHAFVGVSGSYDWIAGLISQSLDSSTGFLTYINSDNIRGKSLEFQLGEKRPSGWEGRVSYDIQEHHKTIADGDGSFNSPRHLAKINFIAPALPKRLFLGFECQEVSKRETVYVTKLGGFFIANATVYSKEVLNGLQVSASLYNAFNKHYEAAVGQEFRQNGILQDGRTFRVKLTYRLKP